MKTLKDLQKEYEWKFDTYSGLRQEAIKWVSECEKEKLRAFNSCDEQCIISQINWIKHFFNLNEEEITNEKS